jgi:uncharacterized protein YjbJ (UPF0337 family)
MFEELKMSGGRSSGIALKRPVLEVPQARRSPRANMVAASVTWGNATPSVSLGRLQLKEQAMDWNRVEGNWKQVKGKVKEQWGKLTDDDLDVINGKQDQLEGRLQQRYGYAKDQAKREVDEWYGRQKW